MDIAAIRSSPVGTLVPINGTDPNTGRAFDHFAFVPTALPDRIDLAPETWTLATEASAALGALRQACTYLPAPELLIQPTLTREAQATSALEGTHGAIADVLESNLPGATPRSPEIREIRGYMQMAYHGFDWVNDRPITMSFVCDLQRLLAQSLRETPPEAGVVRRRKVIIGPSGCPIHDARFVPPPGDDRLQAGVDSWADALTRESPLPPVVQIAMSHYQFETLHPFTDGNGRVGRLLIVLQMLRTGLLNSPSLSLSPWLLRRRTEYQDHLLAVSRSGEWDPWIQFFCSAVREQAESTIAAADNLLRWRLDLLTEIAERMWSGVISQIAGDLVEWPIITNRSVQDKYDVSAPTAKSAIDRLVELGAITELTGRTYGRSFGATEIMAALEEI